MLGADAHELSKLVCFFEHVHAEAFSLTLSGGVQACEELDGGSFSGAVVP